jgi:hypothetical protein
LRPIYTHIGNPGFIVGLIVLAIVVFVGLAFHNDAVLKKIASQFDKTSFVFDLHPFELLYLEQQKPSSVINGAVNELIDNGTIKVNEDNSIELVKSDAPLDNEQLQITTTLSELGTTFYPAFIKKLMTKPIFANTANCMNAFKKHFNYSTPFRSLFYTNFGVLALLLMLSFTRIITGVLRDKPIAQIVFLTIFLTIAIAIFLTQLTEQIGTKIIPNLYKNEILPTLQIDHNWQWRYYLLGTAVLTTSFVPLVNYVDKKSNGNGSCGSSCGSSCGGGSSGGGGGGCGGCGGGD